MTNASDSFFSSGKGLLYPLGSEQQWINRPRGGRIVTEPRTEQERDYATKAPLWWDKEQTQPKMQLVFEVVCDGSGPAAQNGWRTDERVDHADDGTRSVYINGKDKKEAIGAQLKQHGRPGLRIGDHYYECWTGHREGKLGPARTWSSILFPGAGPEQQGFFGNEPQPPAQAPAAPPSGFGQPSAPPAQQWGAPPPQSTPANPGPPPQFQTPPQAPPAQQWGAPPQGPPTGFSQTAQGNAYGFGHQPPESPGGQAYAAQQSAPQGFGQQAPAGPPPQFQAPPQGPPSGFGQQPPPAPQQAPPADNPWGQAPPVQNPYGG